MASTNTTYSCRCLNIRVTITSQSESAKIHVMHHRLVDFLIDEGDPFERFLVCLLCQRPVSFRQLLHPNFYFMIIIFNDEPMESVNSPIRYDGPSAKVLMQLEALRALNSPLYSPTFRVLNTIPSDADTDWDPAALEALRLESYPSQLADIVSDLCNFAIRHNQQLRHEILLTSHIVADGVDLAGDQVRTRSDFQKLCKGLWERHQATTVDQIQRARLFKVFIGPYLARIDSAFSEIRVTSRRDSSTSIDSMEAIALEGISDRLQRQSSPKALLGRGFTDLPTETVWKVFGYLDPVYLPVDLITIQDYYKEVSAFARLSLVSKSWSELIARPLYRRIVLLSDPIRLDKLLQALKVHGSLVQVVVIDDVDIGPVHIRTCSRYIEKCLLLCPDVRHVQCNGDIGLGTSRMHALPSLALILPLWLPVDFSTAFRFAGPDLKRFHLSNWNPREGDDSSALIPSTLPQLHAFGISDSFVSLKLLSRLLDSITKEGGSVLREFCVSSVLTLEGPSIIQLLKINMLCAHITVLRIRLHEVHQHIDNDESLQNILSICPCLLEFSYTSPSSSAIFAHLPQSLRVLELVAVFPYLPSAIPKTVIPRITTVEPFVRYLESPASRNIMHLSIIRQVLLWGQGTGQRWRRLDTQTWDWQGKLQGICRERNIQLCRSFSLHG